MSQEQQQEHLRVRLNDVDYMLEIYKQKYNHLIEDDVNRGNSSDFLRWVSRIHTQR